MIQMNRFEEFVEEKCKDCINRKNEKDLCNIVENIRGEMQCQNLERP